MKGHGYREITLLTRGATTLGIKPLNLPTLKVVVLPIKLSSFTKPFLHSSIGKESACYARRPLFNSWVRKIPWRRERLPTPVFWPGEFHGLGILHCIVHGVTKSWTWLNDFHFHMTARTWQGKWEKKSNNRALTCNLFSNHSRVSNHSFCNSQSTRVRPFSVNTIFPIFLPLLPTQEQPGKAKYTSQIKHRECIHFVSHLQLLHQQLPMNFLLSHCSVPAFLKRMFMYLFGCAGS